MTQGTVFRCRCVFPEIGPAPFCMAPRAGLAQVCRHKTIRAVIAGGPEAVFAAREGAAFISPYNHPDVVAGQGTLGLEIDAEAPAFDVACVPVGGGGLVSGVVPGPPCLRPSASCQPGLPPSPA